MFVVGDAKTLLARPTALLLT